MQSEERRIRRVVTAGVLLAITLVLAFTPVIGYPPVPTPAGNATTVHIPAIIGGILEGPLVGLVVGLGFGFTSFMRATDQVFKDPFVAILPRLFIGLTAAWAYRLVRRANRSVLMALGALLVLLLLVFSYQILRTTLWLGILAIVLSLAIGVAILWWMRREDERIVSLGIAAAVGSLTNTILVVGAAVLRGYWPAGIAAGIVITHGIPEVVVSGIVVTAVVAALQGIRTRRQGSTL